MKRKQESSDITKCKPSVTLAGNKQALPLYISPCHSFHQTLSQASTIYTHTTTMNILQLSLLLAILLKCVIASERVVALDVTTVLEEEEFGSIKQSWRKWQKRRDLFDEVVTKSHAFIINFIESVIKLKTPTLAALFTKRPDAVDEVLKRINYDDYDLGLYDDSSTRIGRTESHENFFK